MPLPKWLFAIALGLGAIITACSAPTGGRVIGGQPILITELPAYPGSVELNPSESQVIEPLFKQAQQEQPPFIGLGIEVVKNQRTFRMPKETTFAGLKTFYADKLQAGGWREDPAMRVLTNQANAMNPNLQGAIWIRVDQTLLIALATDPTNGNKEAMLSLALH
ncbi:MAG TPA: hypothetical protein VFD70_02985 [Anaerolineae bacterium]|nr:hypothetical protein [Anaerolineae bacterium]